MRRAFCFLALLLAACQSRHAPQPLKLNWLDASLRVYEQTESLRFSPSELLAPRNRGLSLNVTESIDGEPLLWILHTRAVIEFESLDGTARELILDATAPPAATPLRVDVDWDGRLQMQIDWEGRRQLRIPLQAAQLSPGRHRLELRCEELRSHAPAGELPVGLGLHGLSFEGVPASQPRLRWRWSPLGEGARLRLVGVAAEAAELAVWLDPGDGKWLPLRQRSLDAGQRFDDTLPLDALGEWQLARLAVVERGGAIHFEQLEQEILAPAQLGRRNVVLVTLDTTRRDGLGIYRSADAHGADLGVADSPTPALDRLAADSQLFLRAYAPAPVTAPTHASLFLSAPPALHGLRNNGQPLPPQANSHLAALLEAWGYRNSAFVSLGVIAADLGFAQGFEHFDDRMGERWNREADAVNAALKEWLAQPRVAGPQFVWLHYSDPHMPYGPPDAGAPVFLQWSDGEQSELNGAGRARRFTLRAPAGTHELRLLGPGAPTRHRLTRLRFSDPRVRSRAGAGWLGEGQEFVGEALLQIEVPSPAPAEFGIEIAVEELVDDAEQRRRYVADLRFMDAAIAEACSLLGAQSILDEDALLMVVADHGEDLGLEDGRFGHVEHVRPTLSWIPMFLCDARTKARRHEQFAGVVDVAPTLGARLGLPLPAAWQGIDLLAAPRAPRSLHLESFPPEASEHWRGLLQDGQLLLGRLDRAQQLASALQLYDLRSDPLCRRDLWPGDGLEAARREELRREWDSWVGSEPPGEAAIDPRMAERLRALGYLD